ncbi:hypothetical protein, partial [Fluviicola sp.]|uniref:hypothetical protein n=1 Tax=Fluviicola sp. TaxID=1917219 RepID=UPI00262FAC1C
STNNLNFYSTNTNTGATRIENRFDIQGYGYSGKLNTPVSLLSEYSSYVLRVHFDAFIDDANGIFHPKEERLIRLSPSNITSVTGLTIQFASSVGTLFNIPEADKRNWRGEIFLGKVLPDPVVSVPLNAVTLYTGKGHTGDKSLKILNQGGVTFLQRRLNLVEGKEYQFSGWFSTAHNQSLQTLHNTGDYFTSPFKVEFWDASNTLMSTSTITYKEVDILQGTFIDEWQKFTLNFVVPSGARYVRFVLPLANEVLDPSIPGGDGYVQYSLFDDLRVQPRDAEMNTYVYNNENQRLEAVLDENNYATFYYYDDEGQLFLVKRETEKGIITVQESRTSLKKN